MLQDSSVPSTEPITEERSDMTSRQTKITVTRDIVQTPTAIKNESSE